MKKPHSRHGKATPLPQSLAEKVNEINPKTTHDSQSAEQTDRTIYPERIEHRSRKQNGPSGERGPRKPVRREQRPGILRVRERQVNKHALRDDEDAHHPQRHADQADDPMHTGACCPGCCWWLEREHSKVRTRDHLDPKSAKEPTEDS